MAHPDFDQLNTYRLDHDLTWKELAADMERRAAIRMSPRTLHYLIKGAPTTSRPTDRTLHKIRRFLDTTIAPPTKRRTG